MKSDVKISIDKEYPDSRLLVINDLSIYSDTVPVSNVTIKIVVPGLGNIFYLPFATNSTNYYSSKNFNLSGSNCQLLPLPDGLYDITYSICPNEELFYNIKYLRVTITEQRLYSLLGNYLTKCEVTKTNKFIFESKDQILEGLYTLLLILKSAVADADNGKYIQSEQKLAYVNKEILIITNKSYYNFSI